MEFWEVYGLISRGWVIPYLDSCGGGGCSLPNMGAR